MTFSLGKKILNIMNDRWNEFFIVIYCGNFSILLYHMSPFCAYKYASLFILMWLQKGIFRLYLDLLRNDNDQLKTALSFSLYWHIIRSRRMSNTLYPFTKKVAVCSNEYSHANFTQLSISHSSSTLFRIILNDKHTWYIHLRKINSHIKNNLRD